MARQKGINPLSGSIGNITYIDHPLYGPLARQRYGPSKERMDSDPAYATQKINYNIFGATSRACGLIRKGFAPVVQYAADSMLNTRLMTPGRAIYKEGLQQGADHPFHTPLLQQLKGFRFNKETGIHQVIGGQITVKIKDDELAIVIPEGIQGEVHSATHYRIGCSMCSFDFVKNTYSREDAGSELLRPDAAAGHSFGFRLPEEFPVHILVIGIIYYSHVNGEYFRLNDYRHAAADIVEVLVKKQGDVVEGGVD